MKRHFEGRMIFKDGMKAVVTRVNRATESRYAARLDRNIIFQMRHKM